MDWNLYKFWSGPIYELNGYIFFFKSNFSLGRTYGWSDKQATVCIPALNIVNLPLTASDCYRYLQPILPSWIQEHYFSMEKKRRCKEYTRSFFFNATANSQTSKVDASIFPSRYPCLVSEKDRGLRLLFCCGFCWVVGNKSMG